MKPICCSFCDQALCTILLIRPQWGNCSGELLPASIYTHAPPPQECRQSCLSQFGCIKGLHPWEALSPKPWSPCNSRSWNSLAIRGQLKAEHQPELSSRQTPSTASIAEVPCVQAKQAPGAARRIIRSDVSTESGALDGLDARRQWSPHPRRQCSDRSKSCSPLPGV